MGPPLPPQPPSGPRRGLPCPPKSVVAHQTRMPLTFPSAHPQRYRPQGEGARDAWIYMEANWDPGQAHLDSPEAYWRKQLGIGMSAGARPRATTRNVGGGRPRGRGPPPTAGGPSCPTREQREQLPQLPSLRAAVLRPPQPEEAAERLLRAGGKLGTRRQGAVGVALQARADELERELLGAMSPAQLRREGLLCYVQRRKRLGDYPADPVQLQSHRS
eukprot:TRINITY_DN47486_c0_g1_i1.p3 TRINITY_DN47486_c0_g1~~TRINITY_DN47486_c0_g1_i1.p3  ORF type:complete len:241 (+),score=45.04 TRINITY_DN47486_c0_g1_i1:75-725(+)